MKPLLIIALVIFSCSALAQGTVAPNKKTASPKVKKEANGAGKITVDITNIPTQTVLLQLLHANDAVAIVDSAHPNANGHFELHFKNTEPELYRLVFRERKVIFLSLNKENVKVTADWNDLDNYKITGSKSSEELHEFITKYRDNMQAFSIVSKSIDSLKKTWSDSVKTAKIKEFDEKKQSFVVNIVESEAYHTSYEPNAILAARMLNPTKDGSFLKAFNSNLDERFPGTSITKDFHEFYQKYASNAPEVGDMAPDVSLSTPDGKTVSLSSLKGHYVLLDFWASWCGPCRGENPNVVAAYNKYKDKNFTIYGVSLDNNKEPWEKAINADGLTWTQVSELKGWQSAVANEYGIKSIPQNFLIDPSGKIIAHNLRGTDLEKTLESTLK